MRFEYLRQKKKNPQEQSHSLLMDELKGLGKSEQLEYRHDNLEGWTGGIELIKTKDEHGHVRITVKEADAVAIAKAEMAFTGGHGELMDIYRIGPKAHGAWLETLWLFNHWMHGRGRGPKHTYTQMLGEDLFEDAIDFYARSYGTRHTNPDRVVIPPSWMGGGMMMNPWMTVPTEKIGQPQVQKPPPKPQSTGE